MHLYVVIRLISISILVSMLFAPCEIKGQLSHLDYNPDVTHMLDRLETSGHLDLKHQSVRYQSLLDILQSNIKKDSVSPIDLNNWDLLHKSIPERKYYSSDTTEVYYSCLLYTSPSPRDRTRSRMPSSA